jgi:hypothetical protein
MWAFQRATLSDSTSLRLESHSESAQDSPSHESRSIRTLDPDLGSSPGPVEGGTSGFTFCLGNTGIRFTLKRCEVEVSARGPGLA